MKPSAVLQEFEEIAEELGIRIMHEKGDFKSGFCLLEKERIIVINKLKPITQRIRAISKAFSLMDTSQIYLKPAIREMIDTEDDSPQQSNIK